VPPSHHAPQVRGRDPPGINPNQAYIYFTARVKEISETGEIPRSRYSLGTTILVGCSFYRTRKGD